MRKGEASRCLDFCIFCRASEIAQRDREHGNRSQTITLAKDDSIGQPKGLAAGSLGMTRLPAGAGNGRTRPVDPFASCSSSCPR